MLNDENTILKTAFDVIKDSLESEDYDCYERFIGGVICITDALLEKIEINKK